NPMATIATDFALQPAPIFDAFETDQGWTVGDLSDDATAGVWVRAAPIPTPAPAPPAVPGGTIQPGEDHSPAPGTICFVTGNAPLGSPDNQQSLRGRTTLTSPSLNLSAVANPRVSYWLWFNDTQHVFSMPRSATFSTLISNDGGTSWTTVSVFQR